MIEALLLANVAAANALGSYLGKLVIDDLSGNETYAQQLGIVRAHMVVSEALIRSALTEKDPAKQKEIFARAKEVAALADSTLKQGPEHAAGSALGALWRDAKATSAKFLSVAAGAVAAGAKAGMLMLFLVAAGGVAALVLMAKGK